MGRVMTQFDPAGTGPILAAWGRLPVSAEWMDGVATGGQTGCCWLLGGLAGWLALWLAHTLAVP